MLPTRYLTLYEFNWLPAMYSHISRLGIWTPYLVGESGQPMRREPDNRLMHRLSSEMMRANRDGFEPLENVPDSVWPLAPNQWLQQVAFEMGLATLSSKSRSSFDRKSVLELVSVIGADARRRSLYYLERFPVLGHSLPSNHPIRSRNELIALGGQTLCEAVDQQAVFGRNSNLELHTEKDESIQRDRVVRGVRNRLNLRFPLTDQQVSFSKDAGVEIRILLREICEGNLQTAKHPADRSANDDHVEAPTEEAQ